MPANNPQEIAGVSQLLPKWHLYCVIKVWEHLAWPLYWASRVQRWEEPGTALWTLPDLPSDRVLARSSKKSFSNTNCKYYGFNEDYVVKSNHISRQIHLCLSHMADMIAGVGLKEFVGEINTLFLRGLRRIQLSELRSAVTYNSLSIIKTCYLSKHILTRIA